MFIDYLTLLLVNMTAGLFLLGCFFYHIEDKNKQRDYAPGFLIVGIIAFVFGAYLTVTWPLPGSYNSAFGETSVLFGIIFFIAGISLYKNLSLRTVTLYAFFAGLAAIVLGIRIYDLGMTKKPLMTMAGFVLTGLCGVCSYLGLNFYKNKIIKLTGILVIILAAVIWGMTAYLSLWAHMKGLGSWIPVTMIK